MKIGNFYVGMLLTLMSFIILACDSSVNVLQVGNSRLEIREKATDKVAANYMVRFYYTIKVIQDFKRGELLSFPNPTGNRSYLRFTAHKTGLYELSAENQDTHEQLEIFKGVLETGNYMYNFPKSEGTTLKNGFYTARLKVDGVTKDSFTIAYFRYQFKHNLKNCVFTSGSLTDDTGNADIRHTDFIWIGRRFHLLDETGQFLGSYIITDNIVVEVLNASNEAVFQGAIPFKLLKKGCKLLI